MAKANIVIDATMLDMLQLCPERFNNRFKKNKTKSAKPRQLDRGTVIHLGFEAYYKGLQAGKHFDDCCQDLISAAGLAIVESDLDVYEARHIQNTMLENVQFWYHEDVNWRIERVEDSFLYVLHEDDDVRISMIGKIDLLRSNNQYTNQPLDHKSYERDSPVPKLSNQFINYALAVNSKYLTVNRVGLQKTLKPADKHKRILMSYNPDMFDAWVKNTISWCMQYLEWEVSGVWPMNFTSCDKYHRVCEYLPVCEEADLEAKAYILDRDYITVEPWDVSKSLSKREE